MCVVKKIAALISIALYAVSAPLYAQSEKNTVQETVVFIDVSKSMEEGFKDLQRHIVDTVIAEVPQDSHVTVFQFYRNMELIYEGTVASQTERYKAANAVYALRPNRAWTNFSPLFEYIAAHNSPTTQFFIYSDGIEEVERNTSRFLLTEEDIESVLPGLAFAKDERNPYSYRLYTLPPAEPAAASSAADSPALDGEAQPLEDSAAAAQTLNGMEAAAGELTPSGDAAQNRSNARYIQVGAIILILIAALAVFLIVRHHRTPRATVCVAIPQYIQDKENGIELSLCSACMYPYGKLFVWSPDFKRQPFLIDLILQKYEQKALLPPIEAMLEAKFSQSIRAFITGTEGMQKKQAFIRHSLADAELTQLPGAESLLREAAILADAETVLLPQHVFAGKVRELKLQYLELLVYWACCGGSLTAPQLALIEKISIDFSISSCFISGFFKAALNASQTERKEHIETLFQNFVLQNPEINVNVLGYLSLLDSTQYQDEQSRKTAAFKKKCLKNMRKTLKSR